MVTKTRKTRAIQPPWCRASMLGSAAQVRKAATSCAICCCVAVVPSALKNTPANIRTKLVTHRDEPLPLKVAVIWDRRRTTARCAEQFAHLLAEYVTQAYPAAGGRRRRA